ncbi:hypothetical protein [Nocardiopsis sp. LOL_012]|uniref:hypothetical protein n=1 Tax=Nocardiopsis sp. LOL_012 TaxID=3345409 RepID=UPI003A89F3B0
MNLEEELLTAADRPLRGVFNRKEQEDKEKLENLVRICYTVRAEAWGDDPTRALRLVVRDGVNKLPEEYIEGMNNFTWRDLGLILYALRDDLSINPKTGQSYTYNDLIQLAKDEGEFRGSKRTWGRTTQSLRKSLAHVLEEMESEALLKINKQAIESDQETSKGADSGLSGNEDEPTGQQSSQSEDGPASYSNYGLFNFVFHGPIAVKTISTTLALVLVAGGAIWAWSANRPEGEARAENAGSSDNGLQATLIGASNEISLSVAFREDQEEIAQSLVNDFSPGEPILSPQAVEAGGYPTDLLAGVDLKRTGDSEVIIHDIRPVKIESDAPVRGTLLRTGGGNPQQVETMHFLMDEPEPVARLGLSEVLSDPGIENRYFDYQTIRVGDGQRVSLAFQAYWSSFEFQVEVEYEVDGQYETELVRDRDGDVYEFRLSAHVCPPEEENPWGFEPLNSDDPPHYENVWTQGIQSRTIREIDPATFCEDGM